MNIYACLWYIYSASTKLHYKTSWAEEFSWLSGSIVPDGPLLPEFIYFLFEFICIFTSKIFTLQICTDWKSSFFCLLWYCCLIVSSVVVCREIPNTLLPVSLVCATTDFIDSILLCPFPWLESHRLLILFPEEAAPNLWVSVYFCSSTLYLFCGLCQMAEIACGFQETNRELMHSHHSVTVSEVTGHKISVNELWCKTREHWKSIDFMSLDFIYVSLIHICMFSFLFCKLFSFCFLIFETKICIISSSTFLNFIIF